MKEIERHRASNRHHRNMLRHSGKEALHALALDSWVIQTSPKSLAIRPDAGGFFGSRCWSGSSGIRKESLELEKKHVYSKCSKFDPTSQIDYIMIRDIMICPPYSEGRGFIEIQYDRNFRLWFGVHGRGSKGTLWPSLAVFQQNYRKP